MECFISKLILSTYNNLYETFFPNQNHSTLTSILFVGIPQSDGAQLCKPLYYTGIKGHRTK